jgi:hypothetical protein
LRKEAGGRKKEEERTLREDGDEFARFDAQVPLIARLYQAD